MRIYKVIHESESTGDRYITYAVADPCNFDDVMERERRDGWWLEIKDVTDEVFHAGDSSRVLYAMNMWNEAYPENKFSEAAMQTLCGFILWNFKV